MTKSPRKAELSILNVFFCLLVVYIHVVSQTVGTLDRLSWQYALLSATQRLSFVSVYGFFFLSGLKLTLPRSKPRRLGEYYLGRVRSILLPYILAAAVYYLYFGSIGWVPFTPGDFCRQLVLGTLSSPFYFVITLAQFILLTPAFLALVRRYSPVVTLPLALAVTWLSAQYLPSLVELFLPGYAFPYADRVFPTYLVYYLAGCYAGQSYDRFPALLEENRGLLLPLAVIFTLVNGALTAAAYSGRAAVPSLELVHTLYLLTAIPALYLLSLRLAPKCRGLGARLLGSVDRASYLIYLYHCLVVTRFNNFAAGHLAGARAGILLLLRALVVFPVTILGCILWQKLYAALRPRLFPETIKPTKTGGTHT